MDDQRLTLVHGGDAEQYRRVGTGYLITPRLVLTARHVVVNENAHNSPAPWLRFKTWVGHPHLRKPDRCTRTAKFLWAPADLDVALLLLDDPVELSGTVSWGNPAGHEHLPYLGLGFPWATVRDGHRSVEQLAGRLPPLAGGVGSQDLLVLDQDSYPDRLANGVKPWAGASGTAVFCGEEFEYLVGVVVQDNDAFGNRRLHACPVRAFADDPDFGKHLQENGGNPPKLVNVETSPTTKIRSIAVPAAHPLSDYDRIRAGYVAQLWDDIVPPSLFDRNEELAELEQFCAGEEVYQWWQGERRAGKSAWLGWWVLHHSQSVEVVWFFVTEQWRVQSDSDAFTESMIEQLAFIAGEPIPPRGSTVSREREYWRLLEQGAKKTQERGRRLVLAVDGLDEDCGTAPGARLRSIASLLPQKAPAGVRILVTSRPHLNLPNDVDDAHPLRACVMRALPPSPHAEDKARLAERELERRIYDDDSRYVEIIGYIAASDGGLTARELAELTGHPSSEIKGIFEGPLGRTVSRRRSRHSSRDPADYVYLFSHNTLKNAANSLLAEDVQQYRERIYEWAEQYRSQQWPDHTPQYLLRPYGLMLEGAKEIDRLVVTAADPARHDRMLEHTGGDANALDEIQQTKQALLAQPNPDLVSLVRLTACRANLVNRSDAIPPNLLAIMAQFGNFRRAKALALSVTDPFGQAIALAAVAEGLAGAQEWDRAEYLASSISTDTGVRTKTFVEISKYLAGAQEWDRAEYLANSITDPFGQAVALAAIAERLAAHQPDRAAPMVVLAEMVSHSINIFQKYVEALTAVAKAFATTRRWVAAEEIVHSVTETVNRVEIAATVVESLVAVQEWFQADRMAALAEQMAFSSFSIEGKIKAFTRVVKMCAVMQEWDRAEQVALCIPGPSDDAKALTSVVQVLLERSEWDRAEELANRITNAIFRDAALERIVEALALARRWDRAEEVATSISEYWRQADALTVIAEAMANADEWGRAEQLLALAQHAACKTTQAYRKSKELTFVVRTLVCLQQWENAEQVANRIPDSYQKTEALATLARELTSARRWDRAEKVATSISDSRRRAEASRAIAEALANDREWDRAETVARDISAPLDRDSALLTIVKAFAAAEQWERAGALACTISDPERGAGALAAARLWDRAVTLAEGASNPYRRANALTSVVEALITARSWDRAEYIARSISEPYKRAGALSLLLRGLADLQRWDRVRSLASDLHSVPTLGVDGLSFVVTIEALAEAGCWDQAEDLAYTVSDCDIRSETLKRLAKVFAAAEQWNRARNAARDIVGSGYKADAMVAVSKALASVKRWHPAEEMARSIEEPDKQVEALAAARCWSDAEALACTITEPDKKIPSLLVVLDELLESKKSNAYQIAHDNKSIKARRIMALILSEPDSFVALPRLAECAPNEALEACSAVQEVFT